MEQLLQEMLQKNYGKNIQDASKEEIYTALLEITKEKMAGMKRNEGSKKLYYISGFHRHPGTSGRRRRIKLP